MICKSCGSEVSPYITECPYCGNRLRKRAPKLDREGRVTERRRLRGPTPALPRLRRGEIPGIRPEARPYGTLLLVALGMAGTLLWRTGLIGYSTINVLGPPGSHWWRLFTAAFVYNNLGYATAVLGTIALYGWLLERRHGAVPVMMLFLLGGVGTIAVAQAVYTFPLLAGANGAALALLCAWAVPDLLSLRAGEEIEGDLLGTAVIAGVVALMPLATPEASWIADGIGPLFGLALGLPLSRLQRY